MSTSNVGTGVTATDPSKIKNSLAAANGIIGALGPATENSFNGLKYTQMGLSAGTMTGNPYVAAVGAVGGFVADSITAKQNRRDAQNEVIERNQNMATQLEAFSPYRGGGFNQVNEGWFADPTQMNVGAPRYASGGRAPLGHIIPVEKVHQALADADAASADVSGGIVPGAGGPKQDNMRMAPGGKPINVSSGELFVGNDVFGAMAQSAGMSAQEYAQRMYPNAQQNGSFAYGGEVDGDPKVVKSSNLTGENYRRQVAMGMPGAPKPITSALPGDQVNVGDFSLNSAAPPSGGTNAGEARPISMGRTDPSTTAGLKTAANPGIGGPPSNDLYGNSPDYDKLHLQNERAGAAQLGLVAASALFNATRQRRETPPPQPIAPNKLDLQTGALRTGLDSERQRGLATGIYNTRDQQGIGRNLGLVAADLEARRRNAMTVEDVENREREVNTQVSNTAMLYNSQQLNRFNENETARTNEFRQMKANALSGDIASASGVIGSMANNGISIEAMRSSEELQRRYLMFMSGATGTRAWTGEDVLGQPRA